MNKIYDISSSNRYNYDQLYNKRNQYATVFDDKKIVEHNYYIQKNNNIDNKDIIAQRDYRNSSLNHIINGKKFLRIYNIIVHLEDMEKFILMFFLYFI